jgi:hypothetical protein
MDPDYPLMLKRVKKMCKVAVLTISGVLPDYSLLRIKWIFIIPAHDLQV